MRKALRAAVLLPLALVLCNLAIGQDLNQASRTCEADRLQWNQWRQEYLAKAKECNAAAARISTLESQANSRAIIERLSVGLVFGVGAGLVWALVRVLRWVLANLRRWTSAKKQLIVLLAVASWMTIVALIGISRDFYPIVILEHTLLYSLPGLLFGGIAFWWFSRKIVADPQETPAPVTAPIPTVENEDSTSSGIVDDSKLAEAEKEAVADQPDLNIAAKEHELEEKISKFQSLYDANKQWKAEQEGKFAALNATVSRLTTENEQLKKENRSLVATANPHAVAVADYDVYYLRQEISRIEERMNHIISDSERQQLARRRRELIAQLTDKN